VAIQGLQDIADLANLAQVVILDLVNLGLVVIVANLVHQVLESLGSQAILVLASLELLVTVEFQGIPDRAEHLAIRVIAERRVTLDKVALVDILAHLDILVIVEHLGILVNLV
jgi:hypothetical protein